jgi:hypothetical protein
MVHVEDICWSAWEAWAKLRRINSNAIAEGLGVGVVSTELEGSGEKRWRDWIERHGGCRR